MARIVAVVLVLVWFVLGSAKSLDIGNKRAILKRLEQCKGASYLPVVFHNVVIAPDKTKNEMAISFKVTVKKQISSNFSIMVSLSKCDSSGNPDSCEIFVKDYKSTNICQIMGAKNEAWTDFMDHFDMPGRCPIKPGVYTMTKTPITTEFMKYMPISDALWKIKFTGWDGGYIACVELEEQVLAAYGRKRN